MVKNIILMVKQLFFSLSLQFSLNGRSYSDGQNHVISIYGLMTFIFYPPERFITIFSFCQDYGVMYATSFLNFYLIVEDRGSIYFIKNIKSKYICKIYWFNIQKVSVEIILLLGRIMMTVDSNNV